MFKSRRSFITVVVATTAAAAVGVTAILILKRKKSKMVLRSPVVSTSNVVVQDKVQDVIVYSTSENESRCVGCKKIIVDLVSNKLCKSCENKIELNADADKVWKKIKELKTFVSIGSKRFDYMLVRPFFATHDQLFADADENFKLRAQLEIIKRKLSSLEIIEQVEIPNLLKSLSELVSEYAAEAQLPKMHMVP